MAYRTPLGTVRGLGSAKQGTHHWWLQRVTAITLIPLTFFMLQLIGSSLFDPYSLTVSWLADPFNTACIAAWILAVFYHTALGLQVVIEDYVSAEGPKIIAIMLVNLTLIFLALAALLALFRIVTTG